MSFHIPFITPKKKVAEPVQPAPAPAPKVPEAWELKYSLNKIVNLVKRSNQFCEEKMKKHVAEYVKHMDPEKGNPQIAAREMKQIARFRKEIELAKGRLYSMETLFDQYESGLDSVVFAQETANLMSSFSDSLGSGVSVDVDNLIANVSNINTTLATLINATDTIDDTLEATAPVVDLTQEERAVEALIQRVYQDGKVNPANTQEAMIDAICKGLCENKL